MSSNAKKPPQRSGAWLPLRGPSGRLYGYYDPHGQIIEVKRGGAQAERIDLARIKEAQAK